MECTGKAARAFSRTLFVPKAFAFECRHARRCKKMAITFVKKAAEGTATAEKEEAITTAKKNRDGQRNYPLTG